MLEDIKSWVGKAYGKGNILLSYVLYEHAVPLEGVVTDPGYLRPTNLEELKRQECHCRKQ